MSPLMTWISDHIIKLAFTADAFFCVLIPNYVYLIFAISLKKNMWYHKISQNIPPFENQILWYSVFVGCNILNKRNSF